jgi:hypothetical protein
MVVNLSLKIHGLRSSFGSPDVYSLFCSVSGSTNKTFLTVGAGTLLIMMKQQVFVIVG